MVTLTTWSFAGKPLRLLPACCRITPIPRNVLTSANIFTSDVISGPQSSAVSLQKRTRVGKCPTYCYPVPDKRYNIQRVSAILKLRGAMRVTAIQINMLAVTANEVQCGIPPRIVSLIFVATESSFSRRFSQFVPRTVAISFAVSCYFLAVSCYFLAVKRYFLCG